MPQAPADVILTAQNVRKSFGAQDVLRDISFAVHAGDRIGLVGNNGSGKSTLLRILAGDEALEGGKVTYRQGLRVAMLRQRTERVPGETVGSVLEDAVGWLRELRERHEEVAERLAGLAAGSGGYERLHAELDGLDATMAAAGAWDLEETVKRVSIGLRLPEPERRVDELSGGEERRLDLAATMARRPDLLLLDEPTNHIDVESVQWIEDYLASYGGSCVLVTHDRYFLDRVVSRILELEFGRVNSIEGSYGDLLDHKAKRTEQMARRDAANRRLLKRELAWLRRGPKARTSKDQGRKQRFQELAESMRREHHREFMFHLPEPPRLSKVILEVENLAADVAGNRLFSGLSFIMQKGMCVGVVGPNGCGKTTMLRTIMGEREPALGSVTIGERTEFLYVDQGHEEIDPGKSVLQYVTGGTLDYEVRGQKVYIPRYLESFLFDGESIRTPMRNLSGGERNRLDLAKKLLQGGNFLILDEPTNDLDLTTLRVLEETVEAFDGCSMLVSHDRYFLNRLCTHMIVFESGRGVTFLAGDFDDWMRYKERRDAREQEERPEPEGKPAPPEAKPKPRRLTWREKRELETMEESIIETEADIQALEDRIGQPEFYEQEHTEVREVIDALESAKERLERLYARWQELERIAEESGSRR